MLLRVVKIGYSILTAFRWVRYSVAWERLVVTDTIQVHLDGMSSEDILHNALALRAATVHFTAELSACKNLTCQLQGAVCGRVAVAVNSSAVGKVAFSSCSHLLLRGTLSK